MGIYYFLINKGVPHIIILFDLVHGKGRMNQLAKRLEDKGVCN